ncbi:amidohydrolase family protein [Arcticibacter sp.]|jgi:cytosine/adenosine deaminase-related metal-dependent hydrolase|uniref:amidohydrolase family protein n=1 Tax=Arcticibacter sp. TaxID=1872630 RepID=UPI00388D13F8
MNTYYSADYILPASSPPIKNGYVAVNEAQIIQGLYTEYEAEVRGFPKGKRLKGVIVPGFVNTHCHLELSWLKGKIERNKGLVPFIKDVIRLGRSKHGDTVESMYHADRTMFEKGIVAVGDISNLIDSKPVKLESAIKYHTFVETLGFDPSQAKDIFDSACKLKEEFAPLKASIAPHAPYSTSKELLRYISRECGNSESLMSIHNQESEEENTLFRYKTGLFLDFYKGMNIDTEFFKAQARSSVQSIFSHLGKKQKILLVHNTYTSLKDIYFTKRSGRDIFWCFCPNANLYIENRLPKIELFRQNDLTITLGTDSLASNDELCILSELKTLHKHFPSLRLDETVKWATLNGAKFLDIDEDFGSIEVGKKPGLNLISHVEGLMLTPESTVEKLV